MPLGRVCQLRYDGTGAVSFRDSSEDSVVPFYKASDRLLIGQQVRFFLHRSAGWVEAMNVACAEECSSTESKPDPPKQFLQEPQLFPVVSTDKSAQLPLSRKLQCSVFRYHNATLEERLLMISQAEERLESAMSSSQLDGVQLCRLVNRCAGWLHAVSLDRTSGGRNGDGGRGSESGCRLQFRVRKLLIRTLEQLDLADGDTFQLLEASLTYIWHLLSKVNLDLDQLRTLSGARKQWHQLQCLLGDTQLAQSDDALSRDKREAQALTTDSLPDDGQGDRGAVGTGVYHPQERVRRLPTVFQSEKVILQCPSCGTVINSTWRWRHPVNGKLHVLVPHNGHAACTKKVGRRCLWQVLGSMAPKTDHFAHLVFCKHNRREGICKDCGGREMPGLTAMVTRQVLLMQLDTFWQQHLKNMDFMKTGMTLRAYGQKNPLTEYKLEGYQVFLKMMSKIRRNGLYNVFLFQPRKLTLG
eukprot:s376_g29.t1